MNNILLLALVGFGGYLILKNKGINLFGGTTPTTPTGTTPVGTTPVDTIPSGGTNGGGEVIIIPTGGTEPNPNYTYTPTQPTGPQAIATNLSLEEVKRRLLNFAGTQNWGVDTWNYWLTQIIGQPAPAPEDMFFVGTIRNANIDITNYLSGVVASGLVQFAPGQAIPNSASVSTNTDTSLRARLIQVAGGNPNVQMNRDEWNWFYKTLTGVDGPDPLLDAPGMLSFYQNRYMTFPVDSYLGWLANFGLSGLGKLQREFLRSGGPTAFEVSRKRVIQ